MHETIQLVAIILGFCFGLWVGPRIALSLMRLEAAYQERKYYKSLKKRRAKADDNR